MYVMRKQASYALIGAIYHGAGKVLTSLAPFSPHKIAHSYS